MSETIVNGFLIDEFIDKEDENNSFLLIYTQKNELLNLKAKGINKSNSKNRNNLSMYSLIEFEYFSYRNELENKGLLKTARLIKPSKINTKNKLIIWSNFSTLIKLEKNIEEDFFHLLIKLNNWNEFEYKFNIIFYSLIMILQNENYNFTIDRCAIKGEKANIISFDFKENGLICSNCKKKYHPILSESFLIKIINFLSYKNISEVEISEIDFKTDEKKYLIENISSFFNDMLGINIFDLTKIIW